MNEHFDAVVIGAGLGGLGAAVTLVHEGKRVLVLEHHTLPGGYAQSFTRGPYRFDTSLHALIGLAPGGGNDRTLRELGVWDRVTFDRLDPMYVARFPDLEVAAPADRFAYESELIGLFPDERDGIRAYLDETRALVTETRRMEEDARRGGIGTDAFVQRYPLLARMSGETWAATIARHVRDARLQAVLGSFWPYGGLPPSSLSALMGGLITGHAHDYGAWYPRGSSSAVSAALESEFRELGGEVRYEQRVVAVRLDRHGRAVGVTTIDGHEIDADVVVSNASAPATMLSLLGREHLSPEYVAQVEGPAPSYTTFAVYLGLDRDLWAEQHLPHELFLYPTYDHDASYRAAMQGDWEHAGLSICDYTRVDPRCAPARGAAVVITTTASWDYADVWGTGGDVSDYHENARYRAVKEQVADALVDAVVAHVHGLRGAIRYREASTPLTNYGYTLNPRGAIEGYENTVANSGLGWLPQQTPVPNLFLAGAWTNTGGQTSAMRSGRDAGRLALALLAHEHAAA